MKIFFSVVFTTLCSFSYAQESSTQSGDSSTTSDFKKVSSTFVIRTDVLDLLATLIEPNNLSITAGLEFSLAKKYSIRLHARTEHISDRFFSTTQFRSGPEIVKYFCENVNGSFYGGAYLEYNLYKSLKYEGKFTTTRINKFFSPGITTGYCYSVAKHFIIEPSLRFGYGDRFEETHMNVRIGLYVGWIL